MAFWLCWVIGILVGLSVYLLLGRQLLQWLFGIVILSSTTNLILFVSGRLYSTDPPFIPRGVLTPGQAVANPLPQALILTAIVIGFGLLAFALVLVRKVWRVFGTMNSDKIRMAEPAEISKPHSEEMY